MLRKYIIPLITVSLLLLGQSVANSYVSVKGVIPNLALIALVFFSMQNGPMSGQISGFFSGLIQDFISLSPLGFHAAVKTLIGFLSGLLHGNVFSESIFFPFLFIVIANLLRLILLGIISFLFPLPVDFKLFSFSFLIETGITALLAPFCFALLRKLYSVKRRKTL